MFDTLINIGNKDASITTNIDIYAFGICALEVSL